MAATPRSEATTVATPPDLAEPSKPSTAAPAHEPPDGGWAWVVLVGAFLSQTLSFGFYGAAAVYVPVWMDFFDSSATETSLIVSISSFFMGFLSLVAGVLITRFSLRSVWMAGGVLASAGLLVSALANGTLYLILSMSFIAAFGFSLCVNCGIVALSVYFKKRLTVAVGIASAGFAAGQLALTPLLDYLIDEYGWRGSVVILAGILMHMVAAGALVRPLSPNTRKQTIRTRQQSKSPKPRTDLSQTSEDSQNRGGLGGFDDQGQSKPNSDSATICKDSPPDDDSLKMCFDEKDLLWARSDSDDDGEEVQSRAEIPSEFPIADSDHCGVYASVDSDTLSPEINLGTSTATQSNSLSHRWKLRMSRLRNFMLHQYGLSGLFRNPSFVLTVPVGVAHGAGWAAVVFHLDARADSVGLQPGQGASLLAIMGAGAFATSVGHGWFVDKGYISPVLAYILGILCNALATFIMPPLVTFGPMAAASGLFGMATGVAEPVILATLPVLVRPTEVAGATSVFLVCWGTGEIIGGTLAGWIFDTFDSYNAAYYMSGSVFGLAAILAVGIYILEKRKKKGKELQLETDEANTATQTTPHMTVNRKTGHSVNAKMNGTRIVNPMYSAANSSEVVDQVSSEDSSKQATRELTENDQRQINESSC